MQKLINAVLTALFFLIAVGHEFATGLSTNPIDYIRMLLRRAMNLIFK